MKKRIVSVCLVLCLCLAVLPTQVGATSKTADEAINWVKSQVGHSVGYDDGSGYYQCVEFIQAYYQWLGVAKVSGNGADYATNALPSGWTRTAGGTPQKGDILVYSRYSSTVQQYGHVAIYESDSVLYDQDGSVYGATVKRENKNYRTYTYNYWGCIHPNFAVASPSVSFTPWSNSKYTFVGETNAAIGMTLAVSSGTPSYVGMVLYNSSGAEVAKGGESNTYIGPYYFKINEELHYTLTPGTTYKYKFYAVVGGKTYWSGENSFKTTGSVAVSSIALNKTSLSLTEGDSTTLSATVSPSNATNKTVTWSSSNSGIATVSGGKVTAVGAGTATITATAGGKSATCTVTVAAKTVAVTGVSLNKTSLSLTEGESAALTATVSPSNATNKSVTWSSSNSGIATVSGGKVTAVGMGTATITATAGGKSATCTVTVAAKTVEVSSVTLNTDTLSLTEGESAALTATVSPSDATNKTVTWSSGNTSVATVSGGLVTAVSAGTATITATAGGKSATCTVTVAAKTVEVSSVTLNTDTLSLTEGESAALTATVSPSDATNKTVAWSSSDTSVATVSGGQVTAVGAGAATITAAASGRSTTCTVTVAAQRKSVVGVTLGQQSILMIVGEDATIAYTVLPMDAADQTVRVSSSNRNVAAVSVNGNTVQVEAKSAGASTVTVTTTEGGYSATCKVTVTDDDPTDVDKSAWYYDAVKYVMDKGIMSGYGSGLFGPNDNLSRAMVVQVLYNTEGKPAVSGGNQFSDVPSGQWFTDAVRWAANKKIVSGFGGGLFKPNDSLTVEQLAVILYNYSGSPAVSGSPYGVGKYSDWAANALRWAKTQGILDNVPFTDANESGTRAQTAQMLMNFLK